MQEGTDVEMGTDGRLESPVGHLPCHSAALHTAFEFRVWLPSLSSRAPLILVVGEGHSFHRQEAERICALLLVMHTWCEADMRSARFVERGELP
jgi:hypothetical protein